MGNDVRLVVISQDGSPAEFVQTSDFVDSVTEKISGLYAEYGFKPPWISYLAVCDDEVVGICAFKGRPREGFVEIDYFTNPDFDDQGIATEMVNQLIEMARDHDSQVIVTARTLAVSNASTRILEKLGFQAVGASEDEDMGQVWIWHLA